MPNELPNDKAIKFNVGDAGYYRVQYDDASWNLLIAQIPRLSEADRVNLLTDAWALVEANRKPLSHYLGLLDPVLKDDQLAVYDQIIDTFIFLNRLLAGDPLRPRFQQYARGLLRPAFDRVGWEAKPGNQPRRAFLRASLIRGLGLLNDSDIVAGCRSRFDDFLAGSRRHRARFAAYHFRRGRSLCRSRNLGEAARTRNENEQHGREAIFLRSARQRDRSEAHSRARCRLL